MKKNRIVILGIITAINISAFGVYYFYSNISEVIFPAGNARFGSEVTITENKTTDYDVARCVTNGFVFIDGKYIELPYKVATYEGWLLVNNIMVRKLCDWPIIVDSTNKPHIPEELLKNAKSFDDLLIPEKNDAWSGRMARWISRNYENNDDKLREYKKFYESLPFVNEVTFPDRSRMCVTLKNGEKEIFGFGFAGAARTKEDILRDIERSRSRLEERLAIGDTYIFFKNGIDASYGRRKTAEDLPLMVEILASDRSKDDKIDVLRRMSMLPPLKNKDIYSFIKNFKKSDQLTRRIQKLKNAAEPQTRSLPDIPEYNPGEMEQRKLDEKLNKTL